MASFRSLILEFWYEPGHSFCCTSSNFSISFAIWIGKVTRRSDATFGKGGFLPKVTLPQLQMKVKLFYYTSEIHLFLTNPRMLELGGTEHEVLIGKEGKTTGGQNLPHVLCHLIAEHPPRANCQNFKGGGGIVIK